MTEQARNKKCPVIGLCGRSGSGKTTVCESFEKLGIMPIDTDKVYRELTEPDSNGEPSQLVKTIATELGSDIIKCDGTLDRPTLAGKVFGAGNEDRLRILNSIAHKHILKRTEEMAVEYFSAGARGVIVDAPVLYESGFDKECDAVVCVVAPDSVLVPRIMARDSITEDEAMRRLSSQLSDDELRRKADFVIVNTGDCDLFEAAKNIADKILEE